MPKKSRLAGALTLALLCAFLFAACSASPEASGDASCASAEESAAQTSAASQSADASAADAPSGDYTATATAEIKIEGYDPIVVDLYGDIAPKTVENFVNLAQSGFYDGLTFHRIIEGFMMQGGDPLGNGTGGSDTNVVGEFSANGVDNPISHARGVVSMARSTDPDSASSQFFIVQDDSPFLDGEYAAFGQVREGMDVVDAICEAAQPTDNNGTISADQQPVIESITVAEA